jgi:hypothetical protein
MIPVKYQRKTLKILTPTGGCHIEFKLERDRTLGARYKLEVIVYT